MKLLPLAISMLRRDWRAGEWRVLLIALVLAVGSISTVGLFADRVRQVLQQQATSLLGADLRVSAMHPLPPSYRDAALQRGLRLVETASFPTMVAARQDSVLAEIQAVAEGYPLRGKIEIDDGVPHVATHIPERGTLWADTRLLQRLGLHLGEEVKVGALQLRLAAEVVRDVDQSAGFASFSPRVLLNGADLPGSGLVQEGSRINYRLLVAGESPQLAAFRSDLQGRLGLGEKIPGEKIEDVRDARPDIRTALERAEHFLGLAALTAVVLAGVALALAARHFISRHLDACAMMRCIGAGQAQVLRLFLYQFLLLGAAAVLLGGLLGYAAQAMLVQSIAAMRAAGLPLPGWIPLWQSALSGMALLLGFAFLPLWQLRNVPPLRAIRRELGVPPASIWLLYTSGGVVLCALFLWQAGSFKLGLTMLAGLAAGLLVFGLLAWGILRVLSRLGMLAWLGALASLGHAFANLARNGRSNALQTVALSLGGMALLLLTFVRADLMMGWRAQLPPDAPNRFIVNIQPNQRTALRDFFARQQLPPPDLYPMVRGRLVAINQHTVNGDDYPDPRARGLVEREFNLSWSANLPQHNSLVQGEWWGARGQRTEDSRQKAGGMGQEGELSVEEGIARTLGIRLRDTLTYDVAGTQFSAKVVNLRKVKWDSLQVNFFVIAAPGMLEDFPVSYITSFHLPVDKVQAGNALLKNFSNLLLIDTEQMIEQLRDIVEQISQAIASVFLFTLLAGVAVLYAALLATRDERIHEAAILRTLGADNRYLRRLHLAEFAMLGALSGLFAAGGATLLGWVLARFVLDIPYHPGHALWLAGGVGGVAAVTLAGWLGIRHLVNQPPLAILRE